MRDQERRPRLAGGAAEGGAGEEPVSSKRADRFMRLTVMVFVRAGVAVRVAAGVDASVGLSLCVVMHPSKLWGRP